ncbi:MAG: MFS transporter [Solibacillus sp.]
MVGRWRALLFISTAILCALSLWFSASVIADELVLRWRVADSIKAWLSAAVPAGFVIGAFCSALFGLADRFNARTIFALSALLGAVINCLLLFTDSALAGITIRVLTGIVLAGVYPVAVKLLAGWFPQRRGTALGILIAALTIGSAFPHLIRGFTSNVDWQIIVISSSVLALLAAMIMQFLLKDAPHTAPKTPFSLSHLKDVVKNKRIMLANYGYLGHVWELYAMWTWIPVFFAASHPIASAQFIAIWSFITIGIAGAIGCVVGGLLSDKIGRANVTILSMIISGICAVSIGFTFGGQWALTIVFAITWGVSIIADSAQYSAAVAEAADEAYVGTALTFQMCLGFLLTIVSINLIPLLQQIVGWQWVFSFLAVGPAIGIVYMVRFKRFQS